MPPHRHSFQFQALSRFSAVTCWMQIASLLKLAPTFNHFNYVHSHLITQPNLNRNFPVPTHMEIPLTMALNWRREALLFSAEVRWSMVSIWYFYWLTDCFDRHSNPGYIIANSLSVEMRLVLLVRWY